jgi:hypothetical protein
LFNKILYFDIPFNVSEWRIIAKGKD